MSFIDNYNDEEFIKIVKETEKNLIKFIKILFFYLKWISIKIYMLYKTQENEFLTIVKNSYYLKNIMRKNGYTLNI